MRFEFIDGHPHLCSPLALRSPKIICFHKLLFFNIEFLLAKSPLDTASSKETRQSRCVQMLTDLGVDYRGSITGAKSTLNRFLRHDAHTLGILEIGNGNNRNLIVRPLFSLFFLFPFLTNFPLLYLK